MDNTHKGTFVDFHLKIWGESIDADKATKLPMPSDDDDKDHAKIVTTTKLASTTTMSHPPAATNTHDSAPTDHPDRPAKVKPSHASAASTASATASGTQAAQASPTNWVSWLPSFGVSEKAQAWIYGALALIVLFCAGLGGWFLWQRRRNANNNRDNYEFELINEEEAEGLNRTEKGAAGAAGGKGRRTRGGELYDAFAGGSDDDDEDFVPAAYRDQEQGPSGSRSRDGRGGRAGDLDEEEQHVIGDDSDDERFDEKQGR